MGGGMAGHLHQGFGAAAPGRFGENVTVGVGFAGKAGRWLGRRSIRLRGRKQPSRRQRPSRVSDRLTCWAACLRAAWSADSSGAAAARSSSATTRSWRGVSGAACWARKASRSAASSWSRSRVACSMTWAWSNPRSPASNVLAVTGIRSASARPTWTRLDTQPSDSPDRPRTNAFVDAAPSYPWKHPTDPPVRSAGTSADRPAGPAPSTSGNTSTASTPDVSAETAAASSASSACACAAFTPNSASIMCSSLAEDQQLNHPIWAAESPAPRQFHREQTVRAGWRLLAVTPGGERDAPGAPGMSRRA